jgi:ABC-2 type transport system ATP-binding protein
MLRRVTDATRPMPVPAVPDGNDRTAAIQIEKLRIVYPARSRREAQKMAVESLTLSVYEGEVFGFLGPNGAGKTSTMNVLLGFLQPSSGSATIHGLDVTNPASRQRLGYLPELTYYYKFLTARELLRFYGRLFEIPKAEREKRISELLGLVEMTAAADKPIRTFSKGMQQRVGLAQALLNNPDLLILDEPTSGLDPLGRMKVRRIIQRLKDEGKTVFFSSHELGEVETVCDRVAILYNGVLKESGAVSELVQHHQCNLEQVFLRVLGMEEQ